MAMPCWIKRQDGLKTELNSPQDITNKKRGKEKDVIAKRDVGGTLEQVKDYEFTASHVTATQSKVHSVCR